MQTLRQDLRYGARMLLKRPGFTVAAVLTLALGIGGNAAIFSLVNSILLRPLPYREPERLYTIWETIPKVRDRFPSLPVSARSFAEWRDQSTFFEQIAVVSPSAMNFTGAGEPERLGAARVSANFFSVVGVDPQFGRTFVEGEDKPQAQPVAVISDSLWRRRFNTDLSVIGRSITIDGKGFTVVGVMPRGFPFPRGKELHQFVNFEQRTDVWLPLVFKPEDLVEVGSFNYAVIARLRNGATRAQAQAEISAIQSRIAQRTPDLEDLNAFLLPLQETLVGNVRQGLTLMLAAVGFVLLIVCVNLANLMLSRAPLRRREFAIRMALGATRARLIAQLLTESLLLALIGGGLGVLLALWGVQALATRIPVDLPRLEEVRIDGPAVLYAIIVSIATGALFGLWPAIRATKLELNEALKVGGRALTKGPGSGRVSSALIVVEVGLSVLLLVGAGLLLRSFVRVMSVDKGFKAENILMADLSLSPTKYMEITNRREFYRRLLEQLDSLPGVRGSSVISGAPLAKESTVTVITDEHTPNVPILERPLVDRRYISPGYFKTMSIPLRQGRLFDESDRKRAVTILSEKIATRLWPGEDPIGKRVRESDSSPSTEVVAVVGDIRASALEKDPSAAMYLPYWQGDVSDLSDMSLMVRTDIDSQSMAGVLREEIRKLDAETPIAEMKTMERVVSESVSRRRSQMFLLSIFAGVAMLLAAVGIYGVVSYSVTERTNEIGIRLALGAERRDVFRLVLKEGMIPALTGVSIGLVAAFAFARVIKSLLFGVSATDPATLFVIAATLTIVALLACWIPARRATKVDPMIALRYQ
ncbi:MAG TPA: ABC transporter permease [Blastocatellia bacterium]|nr:ABC transporter permease [Blastocatellia bacterium]